jgi:hypothetical protein
MSHGPSQANIRLKSQATGKGFELAVATELLLKGIMCAPTIVDAGVDIVAWSHKGRSLNIQVKGRNISGRGTGVETVQFSANSFKDATTRPDFTIIAIRYTKGDPSRASYGNKSFLILSRQRFEMLRRLGYVVESENALRLQLNVKFDEHSGLVKRVELQRTFGARQVGKDVTALLNRWTEIEES